ncbi:MAG: hypothetical protein WCL07_01835 [bacterium]
MARSRLTSVKEKREFRQAIVLIIFTLSLLIGFIFWGLPEVAKLAGNTFIKNDGTKGTQSLEMRPTSPILSDLPTATNSATIALSGFAQPGVEVALYINSQENDRITVTDSGSFVFPDVSLSDGENNIYAFASNPANKLESDQSRAHMLTVDTTKPTLTVSSPSTGSVFRTEKERVVTISGSVNEDGTRVDISDRMAIVSPENTFAMSYQLVEGDQDILIKATDKAGNVSEETLKLRWEK